MSGHPLAGDSISEPFYPLMLLPLLFLDPLRAYDLQLMLQLWLAMWPLTVALLVGLALDRSSAPSKHLGRAILLWTFVLAALLAWSAPNFKQPFSAILPPLIVLAISALTLTLCPSHRPTACPLLPPMCGTTDPMALRLPSTHRRAAGWSWPKPTRPVGTPRWTARRRRYCAPTGEFAPCPCRPERGGWCCVMRRGACRSDWCSACWRCLGSLRWRGRRRSADRPETVYVTVPWRYVLGGA